MKNKPLIYILVVLGLAVISLSVNGQTLVDDYGTQKPATKERREAVVKFHVALELMSGRFTPEQKQILLNAINDAKSFDEGSTSLFTESQARQIFYAIGTRDIAKFKTVFKISTLADKRLLFVSYDKPGRAEVWRGWFAYVLATRTLTGPQIDELIRLSEFLDTQNVSELDGLAREIEPLFDKQLAREIFGSVGPYSAVGRFCKASASGPAAKAMAGDCVCAVGHYNYSCNDSCSGGGGCVTTDGGCGVLWLFNCTGGCQIGDVQPIETANE